MPLGDRTVDLTIGSGRYHDLQYHIDKWYQRRLLSRPTRESLVKALVLTGLRPVLP